MSDAELPVLRATWATLQLAPSLRQPALSYLLSRPPSAEENGLVQKYLEGHGDNRQAAYEDVIWSLLNTKEFLFNH